MTDPVAQLQAALADRYAVDQELGRGGMATVYLARDLKHERFVALKTLRPEIAAALGRERFLREIRLAAKLQHPNVLAVYDSGDAGGVLYYVMPYVEGESLRDRLEREKQLPIEEAIQIARETADALAYAHSHDVVHRDIKPENIMLTGGHAIVMDFGIARAISAAGGDKVTETGLAIGTPAYMSPEQAAGTGEIDRRSDIYALGCVLYEMLAGQPPFTGPTAQAVMARHSLDQVPRLRIVREAVPDALEAVIMRALAKVPADRFQTAHQFGEALVVAATAPATPLTVSREVPAVGPRPWFRRPATLAAGLVFIAGSGAAIVWGALSSSRDVSAPGGLDPRRIAVLYFEDLTRDTALAHLADGFTEGLIDQLSQVRGLDVISRNGVAQYRGAELSRDSIARALEVGTLVEGSVEEAGPRLRVTVRLVDGASGADVRRQSFELPAGEQLAIRDSLAERAALFLRERLGEELRVRELGVSTRNVRAWTLVQQAEKARKEAERVARNDPAAAAQMLRQADSLLAEAEQLDSGWLEPTVLRAAVAFRQSRLAGNPLEAAPWLEQGLRHAERALHMDARNAQALELRGTIRFRRYFVRLEPDPKRALELLANAERDLRAAVAIAPSLASAWSTLSSLLYQKSEFVEAKLAAQRAYQEDAYLSAADAIIWRLFTTSYDLEQFVEAIRWCDEGQRRFPADARFTECRIWVMTLGGVNPDVAEAWRLLGRLEQLVPERERELRGRRARMAIAAVLARAGLPDSARRVAAAARGNRQIDARGSLLSFEAFVHTLLGDRDTAIALLKQYLTANPEDRAGMAKDYTWWWRSLRDDPRFQALSGEAH